MNLPSPLDDEYIQSAADFFPGITVTPADVRIFGKDTFYIFDGDTKIAKIAYLTHTGNLTTDLIIYDYATKAATAPGTAGGKIVDVNLQAGWNTVRVRVNKDGDNTSTLIRPI